MPLLSAYDDFVVRTLQPLGSTWNKLRYIAHLKSPTGGYEHWGVITTHGRLEANRAIGKAHSEIVKETLTISIPDLFQSCRESDAFPQEFSLENLSPEDFDGTCGEHLEYVVGALTALRSSPMLPSHRAA